jgi:hypothetical protein
MYDVGRSKKINFYPKKLTVKNILTFLVSFVLLLAFSSCEKKVDNNYLIITPEKVTTYAGKNWSSVVNELKNKTGYQYTVLNNGNIYAAISLPAKDPQAPSLNFKLLFNVDQKDRISIVALNNTDSLDSKTSNNLFLYYYDHALSTMTNVNYTWAIDSYDHQENKPVDYVLNKIRSFQGEEAAIDMRNDLMTFQIGLYHHTFVFDIYAF